MARKRSRGEGSSYRRKDPATGKPTGPWVAVYYTPDGKRRTVTGATEREARTKAAARAGRSPRGEQTVADYLSWWAGTWVAGLVSAGQRAPETLYIHEKNVRTHIIPVIGRIPLAELRASHVRDLIGALRRKRLADTTIAGIIGSLKVAMQMAAGDRDIEYNPVLSVDVPAGQPKRLPPITPELAARVLAAVEHDRLSSLYLFGLCCGLRESELLALRWDALDLDGGVGWVRAHLVRRRPADGQPGFWEVLPGVKGRPDACYAVPLPPRLVAALRARHEVEQLERMDAGVQWDEGWGGLVWPTRTGTPIWPTVLYRHVRRTGVGLGVHLTPHHLFRRGCSTLMAAHGVPAVVRRDILGHSTVAMTEDVYTQSLLPQVRAAGAAIGEALTQAQTPEEPPR